MTDIRQGWTSASNAEADLLCPGRHLAQKGIPEPPQSEDAESGTRIHAWLANFVDGEMVNLSADEMEIAQACQRRFIEIVSEWSFGSGHEIFKEERLWCSVKEYRHSGQPDVVLIQGAHALILDYKTGRSEVLEPNTNQQLRDLVALASMRWVVENITVAIVQPFAKPQPPCVYDQRDIAQAMKEMRHRVAQSNNPLSPRIAGEKQCRYCRAKSACKEYAAWTSSALPLIASADLGIQKPWTPEQWVQFLTIAPEAESWIEAKRSEAKRLLEANPDSIPGYELRTIEREKVTNVQAVFEQAAARGVKQEDFLAAVSVTKKGLKEALRSTGLAGKELQNSMEEILFGNVETKATEPSIVKKKKE